MKSVCVCVCGHTALTELAFVCESVIMYSNAWAGKHTSHSVLKGKERALA